MNNRQREKNRRKMKEARRYSEKSDKKDILKS